MQEGSKENHSQCTWLSGFDCSHLGLFVDFVAAVDAGGARASLSGAAHITSHAREYSRSEATNINFMPQSRTILFLPRGRDEVQPAESDAPCAYK